MIKKMKLLSLVLIVALLCNTCTVYSVPRGRLSSTETAVVIGAAAVTVLIPLIFVGGIIALLFYDGPSVSPARRNTLWRDMNNACRNGDLESVKNIFNDRYGYCILPASRNPYDEDEDKECPFFLACESGNVELVRLLMNKIGNFDQLLLFFNGDKKKTVLHAACQAPNQEVFKLLVNEKVQNINSTDIKWLNNCYKTPLHIACECGREDLVRWLIGEKGANREVETHIAKKKPILFACKSGNKDLVKYLIEDLGVNAQEPKGGQILKKKKGKKKREEEEEEERERDQSWRVLMAACKSGNLELVRWLVDEKGFDVNTRIAGFMGLGASMNGPLSAALKKNKVNVARWLVEEKNVDMRASKGIMRGAGNINNLLVEACKKEGDVEVARFLVEKGANIQEVKDELLKIACRQGKLDLLKYIVEEHGVTDLDHTYDNESDYSNKKDTLLHFACKNKRKEVVKYLLDKDVRTDIKNRRGNTAFHVACHRKDLESVKLLVEKGANIHEKDWMGRSPLKDCLTDDKIRKYLKEKAKKSE